VRGSGIILDDREGQRHRPVLCGVRGQPVTCAPNELVNSEVAGVLHSTAPPDLQEDVESTLHVDGKACRAPLVGFDAMTESPVCVAVSPDGVDYPGRVVAVEQHYGEAALDEPSLASRNDRAAPRRSSVTNGSPSRAAATFGRSMLCAIAAASRLT
jgi:hypothetical protein